MLYVPKLKTCYQLCIISFLIVKAVGDTVIPEIYAIIGDEKLSRDKTKSLVVNAEVDQKLILVGKGFSNNTYIAITVEESERGEDCDSYTDLTKVLDDDNSVIFLMFLHKYTCCGYSLDLPRRGDSNDFPQHMF